MTIVTAKVAGVKASRRSANDNTTELTLNMLLSDRHCLHTSNFGSSAVLHSRCDALRWGGRE